MLFKSVFIVNKQRNIIQYNYADDVISSIDGIYFDYLYSIQNSSISTTEMIKAV